MRFTNYLLAAGLTASAFAAPVAVRDEDDSCDADYDESTTAVVAATTLPSSSAAVVAATSAKSSVATSAAVVASSASAAVVASATSAAVVASSAKAKAKAATVTSAASSSSSSTASGKLQWIGANESGAEFGSNLPGVEGTDYIFPSTTAIQTMIDGGMNIFRVPFLMERMAQGTMTATLDATYLASYKAVIEYITTAGAHAVLDAHNFGRYGGSVFTSTTDFGTFWANLATEFADNDNVIFDCNNEFHDEPTSTIFAELNQACVTAIRGAGATSQYIFVEGKFIILPLYFS